MAWIFDASLSNRPARAALRLSNWAASVNPRFSEFEPADSIAGSLPVSRILFSEKPGERLGQRTPEPLVHGVKPSDSFAVDSHHAPAVIQESGKV